MPLTKAFLCANSPRRKAIKLGAIEIDVELKLLCALKLGCTISKYERLCFSLQSNSIIDILHKKSKKIKNQSATGADW